MASHFEIFESDQENRVAGVRRGKTEANPNKVRPVLGEISQNVNGQRRQPKRAVKQGTGFQIFCDENVAAEKTSCSSTSSSNSNDGQHSSRLVSNSSEGHQNRLASNINESHHNSRLVSNSSECHNSNSSGLGSDDKENIPANVPQQTKTFKVFDDVRQQQTRAIQLHPSLSRPPVDCSAGQMFDKEEDMNDSALTVNSYNDDNDSPMVLDVSTSAAQWRVPPIEDNQTVDIFSVPEYSQDIYQYLKESETKHMPKWNYMSKQPDITFSMRSILVDWLVEVAEEYKLQAETLYLAVSYIDRFLSYMSVQRAKLQLVGTACMFIASKYEEIYPPDVGEFVYITDDTYTKKQVLRMEHLVLKVLGFDLSVPTTHLFVNKYCQMFNMDEKSLHLATYLNELSLLDGETFMRYPPSTLAASSIALARHTLGREAWSDSMVESSGYLLDDLKECLVALHQTFVEAETNPQQAIREKYKSAKFLSVADLPPPNIV